MQGRCAWSREGARGWGWQAGRHRNLTCTPHGSGAGGSPFRPGSHSIMQQPSQQHTVLQTTEPAWPPCRPPPPREVFGGGADFLAEGLEVILNFHAGNDAPVTGEVRQRAWRGGRGRRCLPAARRRACASAPAGCHRLPPLNLIPPPPPFLSHRLPPGAQPCDARGRGGSAHDEGRDGGALLQAGGLRGRHRGGWVRHRGGWVGAGGRVGGG